MHTACQIFLIQSIDKPLERSIGTARARIQFFFRLLNVLYESQEGKLEIAAK